MAGGIDLLSGSKSLLGDLFEIDKNPLNQLDGGIQDVVGAQAGDAANMLTSLLQVALNAIVGLPLDLLSGLASALDISTYFGNLEAFLGDLNPLSPDFDPIAAAEVFIQTVLDPTGLLASAESIAADIIGLFPTAIGGLVGMAGLGSILGDLVGLLGNPSSLGSGTPGLPGIGNIPILSGLFGDGLTILESLLPDLTGFATGAIQEVIDTLFGGLTGSSNIGNPAAALGIALGILRDDTNAALELSANAWQQAQQLGGTVIQLVTEVEESVVLSPLQLAEQFLSSIGSWFGQTKQSNSPNNPAVTALAGRQAALEAAILNGSSTTGFNDHLNRASLGSDYTLLGANSPTLVFDGTDDGYLIGGSAISGVHLTPSVLPMVTDRNRFQWSLRGFDNFGHTGRHRVLICGNSGFTNFLAVEVYHTGFADRIRMFTVTGGTWQSTGTQQTNFTPPHKFREYDTIDIAYDPVTNTFFLYFNSSPADYFNDATNIVGHGSGHREVAAVFNFDSDSGATGLGMDDFSVYDYPENT